MHSVQLQSGKFTIYSDNMPKNNDFLLIRKHLHSNTYIQYIVERDNEYYGIELVKVKATATATMKARGKRIKCYHSWRR